MSETAPEQRDVHIHASRDVERQFVLHPADNDVFVRTGKQIIEGCRLSISIGVWLEELRGMFGFLAEWCGEARGEDSIVSGGGAGEQGDGVFRAAGSAIQF